MIERDDNSSLSTRFIVGKNTDIKFISNDARESIRNNDLNVEKQKNETFQVNDVSNLRSSESNNHDNDYTVCKNIFKDFGGYNKEVYEAVSVTYLGLGLIGGKYFSHDNAIAADDNDNRNNIHKSSSSSSGSSSYLSRINVIAKSQDDCHSNCEDVTFSSKPLLSSLQASLSTQLFKPPKGLLIHGPSGTFMRTACTVQEVEGAA